MRSSRILIISCANFVLLAAISVIFPLLPQLQKAHGLTTAELGVMSAASFVAGLFAQLTLARFVDRGYARQLLVGAAAVTAVGLAGVAVSTVFWQFVLARFICGLGYASFGPPARSLAAAEDPEQVGSNLGRLSAGELAGVVIGPVLGAGLASWISLDAPFWILSAVCVLLMYPLARIDISRLTIRTADDERPPATVLGVARRPAVQRAALLYVALFLPVGVYDVLWARYLTDLGATALFIGLTYTVYGLPYVAVALFGTRLIDRVGPVTAAAGGLACLLPVTFAFGLFDRPLVLLGISVVEALVVAIAAPAALAAMADACEPHEIGTGQGLSGAAGIGGAGIAAISVASIYEQGGALWAFGVTVVVMSMVGVLAMYLGARGGVPTPSAGYESGSVVDAVPSVNTER